MGERGEEEDRVTRRERGEDQSLVRINSHRGCIDTMKDDRNALIRLNRFELDGGIIIGRATGWTTIVEILLNVVVTEAADLSSSFNRARRGVDGSFKGERDERGREERTLARVRRRGRERRPREEEKG